MSTYYVKPMRSGSYSWGIYDPDNRLVAKRDWLWLAKRRARYLSKRKEYTYVNGSLEKP